MQLFSSKVIDLTLHLHGLIGRVSYPVSYPGRTFFRSVVAEVWSQPLISI